MSELHGEGQMTYAEAEAALSGAAQSDAAAAENFGPEHGANEPPAEQAVEPTPGADADLGAPDAGSTEPADDSFMGGDFNPDLLPDELKPGFKQLQAEWTRKTQGLAEQRKALEALGSEEELRTAAEFYRSLNDPNYLRDFYGELGNVVRELGLIEDPAAPETAAEPPAAPQLTDELARIAQSDPELSPVLETVAQMQQQLAEFQQQQQAAQEEMANQQRLMAQAAEIDRMVGVVREQHPDYGDDDWQAIYDRAVAFDGNVLQAAELYEADKARIIEQWTASKPVPHAVTPTKGAGTVTEDEPTELTTLDDAQRAAEAFLNANDLQEWSG